MNQLNKKFLLSLLCTFSFCTFFTEAQAQNTAAIVAPKKVEASNTNSSNTDPSEVIRVAIEDVLATMRSNEALYRDHPQQLRSIVEKTVLPYLNITRMAQLSMGKNWKLADATQKESIVREFQAYLIRSYINTLYNYRSTKPIMLSRADNGEDKTTLKVSVENDQHKTVVLFLRLEKKQSQWQIVDINVEGVSLVITARSLFDEDISKKGMNGFIQSLADENKKAALNDGK